MNKSVVYTRNLYIQRIQPFMGRPMVKILTGMRRVGKSCLLRLLQDDLIKKGTLKPNICFIDMESLDFDGIKNDSDLHKFVVSAFKKTKGPKTLLIDEVQLIDKWERAVASLAGKGDIDIVLTGSNAHILSSELATRLSGRYIEFPIFGLSFAEFMTFRGNAAENREKEFLLFLRYGGLPVLHHMEMNDEVIFQCLNSIYSTILLKDIVSRHAIRQVPLLENILRFIFDNIGQPVSANRIAAHLKSQRLHVGVDTVINYLGYFQEALITHKTPRYDIKGRRLLETYDKHYLADLGLRHALLGYREADISCLLENVVYLELRRRGYNVAIGKWGDREIDFIATRQKEKLYIQVAYLLATTKTIKREFDPLQETPDNYPKLVLSMDPVFGSDHNGIQRMHLLDFLLQTPDKQQTDS